MRKRTVRYLWYGQLSFAAMLFTCLLIRPDLFDSSISYLGNLRETIGPFAVGMLLGCYFIYLARKSLPHTPALQPMRVLMAVCIVLIIGIVLTPFTLHPVLYGLHLLFASLLFATELLFGWWLTLKVHRTWVNRLLLAVQTISCFCVILSLSEVGVLGILLVSQATALLSFATLLTYTTSQLLDVSISESL